MTRSHLTQPNLKKESQLAQLEKELGYSFSDTFLLVRALTHVSYDHEKSAGHNEVLEFLGDAVLDLAISDLLIRSFPEKSEGDLSRMRAALVNSTVLPEKAALLNLGPLLRLGKGEERSGGRDKPSILAGASGSRITKLGCKRSARCYFMAHPAIIWFPRAVPTMTSALLHK